MGEMLKTKINSAAWIAIVLWIINIAFQAGTITATSFIRDYVDSKNESFKLDLMTNINQRFSYIDNNLSALSSKVDKINEEKHNR